MLADTNGVVLATTNFVWGTFNLNSTKDFNFIVLDSQLSNQCNVVTGLWMDGKPMTFIQNSVEDGLINSELFPLSSALGNGSHQLVVSLESLDGVPVAIELKNLGLYLAATSPVITSQTNSNGQFSMSWQAGGGLKYQPQYTTNLTSSNWNNLGNLLVSPSNAVMSVFDALSARQRFYRVQLNSH